MRGAKNPPHCMLCAVTVSGGLASHATAILAYVRGQPVAGDAPVPSSHAGSREGLFCDADVTDSAFQLFAPPSSPRDVFSLHRDRFLTGRQGQGSRRFTDLRERSGAM